MYTNVSETGTPGHMRCTFVVICDTIHLLVVILSLRAEIKSGNVLWNNCRLYISNIYSIYLLFLFFSDTSVSNHVGGRRSGFRSRESDSGHRAM